MKKGLKILSKVFIVIGVLLLIWYLCPLVASNFNAGTLFGIIGSAFLILFGVFFEKIPSAARITVFSLMGVFIAAVVLPVSFNMARYADYKTDEGAQTVIVLGCRVRGETPSEFLYGRCLAAAQYLKDNPGAVVIASGGQGEGENISEAECIKRVLLEQGIDEGRIFEENKSTNTNENLAFSKEIIKSNNLSEDVLIVTNEFHEYRAKLYCDSHGLNFHSKSSRTQFYSFLTYYTREMLGIVKYKIFG